MNKMNIEIVKPYQSSEQRIITLDNITITLQEEEVKKLSEELDNDLNYGDTREELQQQIYDLLDEINIYRKELGLR
jgi:ribosomal protein S13